MKANAHQNSEELEPRSPTILKKCVPIGIFDKSEFLYD